MKKVIFVMLVFLVCLGLVGCGTDENVEQEASEEGSGQEEITMVDQTGKEVRLNEPAQRIVSLMPSATEMAYSLGIENQLVGVTDYCDYPKEAQQKESVGGFSDPSLEKIVSLQPDLVITGSKHEELVPQLEGMEIATLGLLPNTVDDVYDALELIGAAAGATDRAQEVISNMQQRIESVENKVSKLSEDERMRVYYELYPEPLMSVGGNSVIHQIITMAGGKNIFSDVDSDYMEVSAEAVVEKDPQVMLFPKDHGTEQSSKEEIQIRPAWDNVTAVQNKRIHSVDADIFSKPGPRVAEGIEIAARLFYPELFE